MADDMILLDGVRYLRYEPESESEFEGLIVKNAARIFGKDAIYLDIKKLIRTEWGKGTIPDGYLFYPEEKRFVLVEVELSSHDVYSHIAKQLGTFIGSFRNYKSRQKLASILREYISNDPNLNERLKKIIKGKGLFDFLLNEVMEPLFDSARFESIVVIERETSDVLGSMKLLSPSPKVLEVALYAREGAESVKAMRFVPQYKLKIPRTISEELEEPDIPEEGDIRFPVKIYAEYKGNRYEAMLYEKGKVVYNNKEYNSVSAAAESIVDSKARNGWTFWKMSETKEFIDKYYKSIMGREYKSLPDRKLTGYNIFAGEKRAEGYSFPEIGKMWREMKGTTGKLNEESFLALVDENGKRVFERILDFAKEKGYLIRWGTKGFSFNATQGKGFIGLFFGYSPDSIFKQSIYTGFEEIRKKASNPDAIIEEYKKGLRELQCFIPAHNNIKWVIDSPIEGNQISRFLKIIELITKKIEWK